MIPEEISSHSLKLGENRRQELQALLLNEHSQSVLDLLNHLATSRAIPLAVPICKCLCSWLSIEALATKAIANAPVLHFLYFLLV